MQPNPPQQPGFPPPQPYGPPGGGPPHGPPPVGGPPFGAPAPKRSSKGLVIGLVIGAVALLLVCGGIGVGGFVLYQRSDDSSDTAESGDGTIDGLVNYRGTAPSALTKNHKPGRITYPQNPPVGGDHATRWQNCEGDVYSEQIPSEHAVHSLEHGAVWVTYRPGLDGDQVDTLAGKVRGKDYALMSPYPGLDEAISLQAWGYQLKVDSADDPDIDKFITKYRQTATQEPGATCGSGVTATGAEPAAN